MIDPELHLRCNDNLGYTILITGTNPDRYLKCLVSQEELESVECPLDPIIDAITYLRDKWTRDVG
jgi:hypothetical protein